MAKDKYFPAGQMEWQTKVTGRWGMVVDVIMKAVKKVKAVKQCVYRLH